MLFDYLVLVAFFLIGIDIFFQIRQVKHERESRDVSLTGAGIRLFAAVVFLIKFVLLSELILIIGQSVFVAIFLYYISVLTYYRKKRKYKRLRRKK